MQNLNNKPREQSDAWHMIELLGQQNKRMFIALLTGLLYLGIIQSTGLKVTWIG